MSAVEHNFSNYELGDSVYELADGLLPEIASAAGHELASQPDAENIGSLIGKIGPDKELQKNISVVREALGTDARDQIAGWIERAGIMAPLDRSFAVNVERPDATDAIVLTGGVANWMMRRAMQGIRLDPAKHGSVLMAAGSRQMGAGEHQLVASFAREHDGNMPTEAQFADRFTRQMFEMAEFDFSLVEVAGGGGDHVAAELFAAHPELSEQTITVVSNAPNGIQAAGELRLAGRNLRADFDSNGDQVYVYTDSFPLARNGEKPATHQNPETALGQLARNALYLVRNQA
jgi:hypothetical protein